MKVLDNVVSAAGAAAVVCGVDAVSTGTVRPVLGLSVLAASFLAACVGDHLVIAREAKTQRNEPVAQGMAEPRRL